MPDFLIYWSDSVGLYRSVSFGLLALLAGMVVWPEVSNRSGRLGTVFFLLMLCAFVVAARWPGLFYPKGFNPDEDQLVAAARALVLDPVFFRAAEAGSSGPLNVYPLLTSLIADRSPTLFSARLAGLGMICLALVAVYFAGRSVFSESVARFGAFLPGVFFGLTNFWDFTHYTSEHMPVALLAVGWALGAWVLFREGLDFRMRVVLACAAVMVFSLAPFAKLQASLAALVSSAILVLGVFLSGASLREKILAVVAVCFSGVVFPGLLCGFFFWNGVFDYFWTSYIQNALAYKGSGFRGQSGFQMLGMILFAKPPMRPVDFLWFSAGSVLVVLAGAALIFRIKIRQWILWVFAGYCAVLLWLAFLAVVAPQRNYPHYLVFLPVPMGMVAMSVVGLAYAGLVDRGIFWRSCTLAVALVIGAGPFVLWRASSPNSWSGLAANWSREKPGPISEKIIEASGGEGRLCVWGYNPTYYSETGMVQATRLSTSGAVFNDNPLRPFFLRTYLEDLQRHRPAVFVDAVAPDQFVMMTKREEHGHEVVPEVREFVAANYTLFDEIDGVRIYKRNGGQ